MSVLAPHLPSSEQGRGGCVRLMGEAPSFGSGGAVAQPCQDSCCPAALQHPKIWSLQWPWLHALPHAAALPRGIGISKPALESTGWRHSSSPAGAACASFTSVRWECPTPPAAASPSAVTPSSASVLEWHPANRVRSKPPIAVDHVG